MQNSTAVDEALCQRVQLAPGFIEKLLPQLVDLVKYSRLLPQGEEHAIRRGSRDFLASSKDLGFRSLQAVHQIFRFVDQTIHRNTAPEGLKNFNLLVDSIDDILERADGHLKNAAAGVQREEAEEEEKELSHSAPGATQPASRLPKPQVRWRHLIDNHRTHFVPRLLVKHNEESPLSPKLLEAQAKVGIRPSTGSSAKPAEDELQSHLAAMGVGSRPQDLALANPYEEELNALAWPDSFFQCKPAQRYPRVEDTPLVMVRTDEELKQMIQEVKATCIGKEIAVDVEHHDFRSYRGFVCLVQVSTRQKDFLLDPFEIFEQMHLLNEIFSDPRILKVLHGADRDVLWLQRDFSVYLVNMFDTGLATRALRLQGGYSLANLVSHFCGVKLDKKYQTADWRERPLPQEMIHYARADTHYLLFCYDCLKNALLAQSGMASTSGVNLGIAVLESGDLQATEEGVQTLQATMQKSAALCGQAYHEAPLDAGQLAMSLCERFGSKQRPLDAKQMNALKAIAEWRDCLARNIDESLNFIAPDACLWRICLAMPTSPVKLRSTCNPLPTTLQQHAQEVVDIIVKCLQGQTPAELLAADPKTPHITADSPPREVEADVPVLREVEAETSWKIGEWPLRSPEGSPRPLVHVTATFGRLPALGRKREFAVLCGADSGSEDADTGPVSVERPQKRARVIRRKISFAAPAPEPAPEPALEPALEPAEGVDTGEEAERKLESEAPKDAEAQAPEGGLPAPMRKRKRKRPNSQRSLENLVSAPQASKPASPAAPKPASVPSTQSVRRSKGKL
ncbi:unnamed protein product [Durusdinium trenchii]|uniref:Uncharacterized protein n=2 Tax=Durusdinium trenchii TaxID=1381693 RepID=A0ABP0M476_9DINO